jgi:predicted benzoate:H+ symporter BenE
MDNIITGAIAVAMFLAFAGGLAESIGEIPFILIVVIVGIMLCTDFYESVKEGLQQEKDKKSNSGV